MENEFNYRLEVDGKDYGSHTGRDGEYLSFVPFKETSFFMTIEEAMDALILKDIRSFEEMSETTSHNRFHNTAKIISTDKEESILSIIRIPFEDSPNGAPTAGIYFWFNDGTVREFEEFTGLNFKGFGDYDPENSFLLLGSYSYKIPSGFDIEVDQVVRDWESSLKYYVLEKDFKENDWKYLVEIKEEANEGLLHDEIKKYHFHSLSGALRQLLKTNINELDKDVAIKLRENSWISKAMLSERSGKPVAEMIAVKNPDTDENVQEPGIHLKCHVPVDQLEKDAALNLSGLGNYNDRDGHLLLANYFVEPGYNNNDYSHYSDLIPNDGYTFLLLGIEREQEEMKENILRPSYKLKLTWEKVQNLNERIEVRSDPIIQELPHSSTEDGLDALLSLEDRLFDLEGAKTRPFPFYLKKAELIDTVGNTVIITKYQKSSEAGKAMYMSFDNDQESLRLLILLDSTIRKRQSGKGGDLLDGSEEIQRKRTSTQRTIHPIGMRSPKP